MALTGWARTPSLIASQSLSPIRPCTRIEIRRILTRAFCQLDCELVVRCPIRDHTRPGYCRRGDEGRPGQRSWPFWTGSTKSHPVAVLAIGAMWGEKPNYTRLEFWLLELKTAAGRVPALVDKPEFRAACRLASGRAALGRVGRERLDGSLPKAGGGPGVKRRV